MVTNISGAYGAEPMQFFGLSTDPKPGKGVPNASVFYEMDTRQIWLFDEQNGLWINQADGTTVSARPIITIDLYGDTLTYTFEEGMTWREWAESSYTNGDWHYGICETHSDWGEVVTNGYDCLDVDTNAVIENGACPYVNT